MKKTVTYKKEKVQVEFSTNWITNKINANGYGSIDMEFVVNGKSYPVLATISKARTTNKDKVYHYGGVASKNQNAIIERILELN